VKYEFGVFLPPSWIAVLLGQNQRPRGYDPRADAAPKDILVKNAAGILQSVRAAARNAPEHAAYIRQIGAASDTAPLVSMHGRAP
jgi:tryptophan halogenase